jgi:hypothetical protein
MTIQYRRDANGKPQQEVTEDYDPFFSSDEEDMEHARQEQQRNKQPAFRGTTKDIDAYRDKYPFLDYDPKEEAKKQMREIALLEEEEQEITLFKKDIPEYLLQLGKLNLDKHEKAALLSIYDSPTTIKSFKDFINKDVTLYGGIVWHHDDTSSKATGDFKAGWDEIRFLALDMQGEPYIIKASYGSLANHVRGMLGLYGWFMWEEPTTYTFGQDSQTNAFRMVNQDRVKTMLAGMKKNGKK